MPEATATRKRRFYGLLDKLTPSSAPAQKPSKTSAPTSRPSISGPVASGSRPSTPSSPRPSTSSSRPSISSPRPLRPDRPSTLATPGAPPPIPRIVPPDSNSIILTPHDAARLRPGSSASNNSGASGTSVDSYRARLNPHAVSGIGSRTASVKSGRGVDAKGRPVSMQLTRPVSIGKRPAEMISGERTESLVPQHDEDKKPHFTPWSHEDFLERLKTFAPVTSWFPKPEGVGEVEWAKRGWECVAPETVGCRGCRKRVVVDFSPSKFAETRMKRRRISRQEEEEDDFGTAMVEAINGIGGEVEKAEEEEEDSEEEAEYENTFEKALAEKYAEEIVNGHSDSCPWRKTGCKDDIYRLPVVRTAWWQETVRTAFASVLEIREDVDHLRLAPVEASPAVDKILLHLPPTFFNENATPRNNSTASTVSTDESSALSEQLMQRALTIALTGWHATCEARTNLLSCDACFQRIGLWMYQDRPATPDPSSRPTTAQTNPNEKTTSLTPAIKSVSFARSPSTSPDPPPAALDLIAQHRDHCPFRSPTSQAATGDFASQPAWRILWTTAARYADEQRRRSVAGKAVGGWTNGVGEGMGVHLGVGGGIGGVLATREEVARTDRERRDKLRRLKSALGIKLRLPSKGGERGQGSWV